MVWTQLKILLPSFAQYWIFLIVVLTPTLFILSKSWPRITFSFAVPVTLATATVIIMAGNAWINMTQNMVMYDFQQKEKAAQTAAGGAPASKQATPADPALQMKADFLKVVEQVANNPEKLTPEIKNQVFAQYGKLFTKPEDKQMYLKNILSVYNCQKYFWEDALSSFQAKKEIKSDARTECEKASGAFFNREKLLTEDTIKSNNETIAKLAGHKRLPAAEGKSVDVNEGMLRNALEKQMNTLAAVHTLFQ